METKLRELREQFERGQIQLAQLDQKRADLRDNLLRLSGAIEVLEDLILQERREQEKSPLTEAHPVA